MKTNVYIDAFNLYYGCLKDSEYRWLNLETLCEQLLPYDTIVSIKYFTARVKARPHNPEQPIRQDIYLRALETLQRVSIIYGHFLTQQVKMPLVTPEGGKSYAMVYKTEEKGSDVNIASHLLHDAHRGDFELAVVISNDSDLVEPIRLVKNDLKLPVGVFNPQMKSKHPSVQLQNTATFFKHIRPKHLAASQFNAELKDARGFFTKPAGW